MKYYHGSRNGELKKLSMQKANHGAIFLAEDYCFAVLYAASPIRSWDTNEDGKLIIREMGENGFDVLYKNKPCYVYSVDEKNLNEYQKSEYRKRKTITTTHDVDLDEVEFIPDAWEKILQLEKEGKLILIRWSDLSKQQQEDKRKDTFKHFIPIMQAEHDRFPEEYDLITTIYPELKLENLDTTKKELGENNE